MRSFDLLWGEGVDNSLASCEPKPQPSDSMGIPCGDGLGHLLSYGLTNGKLSTACKPGFVQRSCERLCGHSLGWTQAHLARPTRTERFLARLSSFEDARPHSWPGLRRGFALPSLLPGTRWALTPIFSPLPRTCRGGLLSVALSRSSPVALAGLGFAGRRLSAALPSWSPDFPRVSCSHPRLARPPDRCFYPTTLSGAVQFPCDGLVNSARFLARYAVLQHENCNRSWRVHFSSP